MFGLSIPSKGRRIYPLRSLRIHKYLWVRYILVIVMFFIKKSHWPLPPLTVVVPEFLPGFFFTGFPRSRERERDGNGPLIITNDESRRRNSAIDLWNRGRHRYRKEKKNSNQNGDSNNKTKWPTPARRGTSGISYAAPFLSLSLSLSFLFPISPPSYSFIILLGESRFESNGIRDGASFDNRNRNGDGFRAEVGGDWLGN